MTSSPEARWICEAQKPGLPSHEFETFGEDAARAFCDLQGWDFIRCYREGSDSDRRGKKDSSPLISAKQMKALITEAQETYRTLTKHGIDLPDFDAWRKDILRQLVKVESFKLVTNRQFSKVRNSFRSIRGAAPMGNPYEGKRQSREAGDTLDMRQNRMFLIAEELGKHARRMVDAGLPQATIGVAYLLKIALAKNPGHTLADIDDLIKLPTSRLDQLLYTIRNRIAAKEGKGDADNRNKKQKGGADE